MTKEQTDFLKSLTDEELHEFRKAAVDEQDNRAAADAFRWLFGGKKELTKPTNPPGLALRKSTKEYFKKELGVEL